MSLNPKQRAVLARIHECLRREHRTPGLTLFEWQGIMHSLIGTLEQQAEALAAQLIHQDAERTGGA